MEVLYIIPARGGSKRLRGKNTMQLCGRPMIAYSIEAAKTSEYRGRVVVSTEDDGIAKIATGLGAEVVDRPKKYAMDESPTIDVILDCLEQLGRRGYTPGIVVVLQPTSPLRKKEDIDGAIEKLIDSGAASCVSVSEQPHPAEWVMSAGTDGKLTPIFGWDRFNSGNKRKTYLPNGAVYAVATKRLLNEKRLYFENDTVAYVMPRERSVDIDTMLDFRFAEMLLKGVSR